MYDKNKVIKSLKIIISMAIFGMILISISIVIVGSVLDNQELFAVAAIIMYLSIGLLAVNSIVGLIGLWLERKNKEKIPKLFDILATDIASQEGNKNEKTKNKS